MLLEAWQPCQLQGRWTWQNEFAKGSFKGPQSSQIADCRLQSTGLTSAREISDFRLQIAQPPLEFSHYPQISD
eukprot:2662682-Prymnesium_polylepis.1